MSGPDRPEPLDPAGAWPDDDDVEATRIVRRDPSPSSDEGAGTPDGDRPGEVSGGEGAPPSGDEVPGRAGPTAGGAEPAAPYGFGAAAAGPTADAEPTSVLPHYQPEPNPASSPTSYFGAPTTAYPGPGETESQPYPPAPPQGGYSYQQAPTAGGFAGTGPQAIAPPATTNVVLPPVRMPKAESRVALNLLGTIVGLILVAGGITLDLLFAGKMRSVSAADLAAAAANPGIVGGHLDALAITLTIVGAVLIALAGLLSAWASWAAILPGVLLAAASVWAMVTTGPDSGGQYIAKGTRWAFKDGQLALFCMNGTGLIIGLLLLATGLAAVFLRAGVRRTIRQQLESIQS